MKTLHPFAVLVPGISRGALVLASTHPTEAEARAAVDVLAHDKIRGAMIVPRMACDVCGFPVVLHPRRVGAFIRCALCVEDWAARAERRALAEGEAEVANAIRES